MLHTYRTTTGMHCENSAIVTNEDLSMLSSLYNEVRYVIFLLTKVLNALYFVPQSEYTQPVPHNSNAYMSILWRHEDATIMTSRRTYCDVTICMLSGRHNDIADYIIVILIKPGDPPHKPGLTLLTL